MKSTSTILIIMAAAFGPAAGREAMLGNEHTDQRRLGGVRFWNVPDDYYTDLYERCCEPAVNAEWDPKTTGCNCPKRLSTDSAPSWAQAWLGSKSYVQKWTDQCNPNGWLCKKAYPDGSECVTIPNPE